MSHTVLGFSSTAVTKQSLCPLQAEAAEKYMYIKKVGGKRERMLFYIGTEH